VCAGPTVPVFEEWAEDAVIAVGFSTLGAIVAPRFPPHNPIGWLFCALGLVAAVLLFGGEYAYYSLLARPGSLPGGEAFAWVVSWLWVVHSGSLRSWGCYSLMVGCRLLVGAPSRGSSWQR
jgi:hypothetical protein